MAMQRTVANIRTSFTATGASGVVAAARQAASGIRGLTGATQAQSDAQEGLARTGADAEAGSGRLARGVEELGKVTRATGESVAALSASAASAGAGVAKSFGGGVLSAVTGVGKAALEAGERMAGLATKAAKIAAGTALGVTAAGAALAQNAAKESTARTLDLYNQSKRTGLSTAGFEGLTAAMKDYGVEASEVRSVLMGLNKTLAEVDADPTSELAQKFQALGLEVTTVNGYLKTSDQFFLDLLKRTKDLDPATHRDFLSQLLGDDFYDKASPLLGKLSTDFEYLARTRERLARSGALLTPADVALARGYTNATNELGEAWDGLRNQVNRVAGPWVQAGIRATTQVIIAAAPVIAKGMQTALGFVQEIAYFLQTGVPNWQRWMDSSWYRVLIDVLGTARSLYRDVTVAAEGFAVAAAKGIDPGAAGAWLVQFAGVRRGIVDVFQLFARASVDLSGPKQFLWELWDTLYGRDAFVRNYPWLIKVRTFIVEFWDTIFGRDQMVTQFPGLLAFRDAVSTTARVAKEAWYAISGQDSKVKEFPILLTLRDKVVTGIAAMRQALADGLAYAQTFWADLVAVFQGRDEDVSRFTWMVTVKQAFATFFAEVTASVTAFVNWIKAAWADVGKVWSGEGTGTTGPGKMVARWIQDLAPFMRAYEEFRAFVVKVTDDVLQAWYKPPKQGDGTEGSYHYKIIHDLAAALGDLVGWAKQAGDIFLAIYNPINDVVKGITGLHVEVILIAGAFLRFSGLLGLIGAAWKVAAGGAALFGVALGPIAKLLGLGAAVGALASNAMGGDGTTGAVAGAVAAGGLAVALSGVGRAATAAGADAAASAGKFELLGKKLGDLIAKAKANSGLLKGLGLSLGAAAVDAVTDAGPNTGAAGFATQVGGGALSGALQGAAVGGLIGSVVPVIGTAAGAAIGTALGGIAGALHGYSKLDPQDKAKRDAILEDYKRNYPELMGAVEVGKSGPAGEQAVAAAAAQVAAVGTASQTAATAIGGAGDAFSAAEKQFQDAQRALSEAERAYATREDGGIGGAWDKLGRDLGGALAGAGGDSARPDQFGLFGYGAKSRNGGSAVLPQGYVDPFTGNTSGPVKEPLSPLSSLTIVLPSGDKVNALQAAEEAARTRRLLQREL